MGYSVEQLADCLTVTLPKYKKRYHWTDLTSDINEYLAMPMLLQDEKVVEDGGDSYVGFAQTAAGNTARAAQPYDEDIVNTVDTMTSFSIPWRRITVNMSYDITEPALNRGESKLIDLIDTRHHAMMVNLADLIEESFWTIKAADDGKTPFGLPYWVVANASAGFNGGDPWTSTPPGGLSHARFKNYTFTYNQINKADLVKKWRRAFRKCRFTAPVPHKSYDQGKSKQAFYMNIATLEGIEEVAEAQNENLGKDVASRDGETVFRGRPLRWAPYLDNDATNPIYGIDWSKLYFVFQEGFYMRRHPPKQSPRQHTVVEVHLDCIYNLACHDRRGHMKAYYA